MERLQDTERSNGDDVMNPDATWQYVVPMTIGSTFFLILAIIVILVRSRTTEMKLVLIGAFMAIAAAAQAPVSGVGVNAAQAAVLTGLESASLMKVSVILTLSGVAMLLMSRATSAVVIGPQTEQPHVD
jgi:hypothetical protein